MTQLAKTLQPGQGAGAENFPENVDPPPGVAPAETRKVESVDTDGDNAGIENGDVVDTDGDKVGDDDDDNDDGDLVADDADALPLDKAESTDTDGDQAGDNADPDDDGDGEPDGADRINPIATSGRELLNI